MLSKPKSVTPPTPTGPAQPPMSFTPYQKFVVALLAFLQFTIILDFMILSPLGALLMPALNMTASQFGWVVSAYAFSAGASGLLAAGFADRFDRKRLLLFFYTGFVLGTLCCALAPTYGLLLAARMVTGIFGGVIGSIVFAITTDLFPLQMRGRVMGVVQTAFAASQVLGIPLGLFFANLWGWHAPFLFIVAVSTVVGVFIIRYLKPIDGHLKLQSDRNAIMHLFHTMKRPRYIEGYAAMALLSTGGFMLMPFGSAFSVNNLGVPVDKLPLVYMITGVSAFLAGPLIGRLCDSAGKYPVFVFGSFLSVAMVLTYTRLGLTPLAMVIAINVLLFVGISSRMIASAALISAVPDPADRGAFMSVNSSLQQISGGLAAALAGVIVAQSPAGAILHMDILGDVVTVAVIVTMVMMFRIDRMVKRGPA